MCRSRSSEGSNKIILDGKPVAVPDLTESDVSLFGGVPLVCHSLTLMLKPSSDVNSPLVKLLVDRKHLLSPLGRIDALQYLMEECNYMAHAWSRPPYHPWYLGPRCLRVLSPRPHMEVVNLTESITGGEAIEGTVNRVVFKLVADKRYDCKDVTLRLRCTSEKERFNSVDTVADGETKENDVDDRTLFVQRIADASAKVSTSNGISLPTGWQPRCDVIMNESHDSSSGVTSSLDAGKSLLLPLDFFRPLNTSPGNTSDARTISTSYEVILAFREVRADAGRGDSSDLGNQVMVIHRGTLKWIKPFFGEFAVVEGHHAPFPCGLQHETNATTSLSLSRTETDIISADGNSVRMRFTLKTNGLGGNVAASIENVVNEVCWTGLLNCNWHFSDHHNPIPLGRK